MYLQLLVTIVSVWELPYLLMWLIAPCTLSTISMFISRSPYSLPIDVAGGGPNFKALQSLGPECIFTCNKDNLGKYCSDPQVETKVHEQDHIPQEEVKSNSSVSTISVICYDFLIHVIEVIMVNYWKPFIP